MHEAALSTVAVIGLSVAVAYMLARRLHVPIVVLYLVAGAVAGPSVLGLVNPEALGPVYGIAVELLVALIVFEGAFSIDVHNLRRVGRVVRNLMTVGLVLTFVAGTLLAGLTGVLPWRAAFMFGVLVTVTGPTVIGPLVRAVRLNDRVRAVLLGEGVLIDPIGAVLAVVVLDFVLSGLEPTPLFWAPSRLLAGAAFALAGAGIVRGVLLLNREPSAAESSLLLFGTSVGTFAIAERLVPGSGLTTVAVMGVVLAGTVIPHAEAVRTFEDDLSKLMIGAVYILAVAAVDLQILRALWPWGFLVVIGLMVIVRPAVAHLSAIGSDLTMRERTYIGLIGPRGVVAASLAAVAGTALGPAEAGPQLTALVFLTILLTVAVQSTYAGVLAQWLRVRAMRAVIAGSGRIARQIGTQLTAGGFDVVLIDRDRQSVDRARAAGLQSEFGDATDVRLLQRLGADSAAVAIGATDSDQVNLLFCQFVRAANPEAEAYSRVHQYDAVQAFREAGIHAVPEDDAVTQALIDRMGSPMLHDALSGAPNRMSLEVPVGTGLAGRHVRDLGLPERVLVLLIRRGDQENIPHGNTVLERGDRMLIWGTSAAVTAARAALVSVE